jgi:hypothetical protein
MKAAGASRISKIIISSINGQRTNRTAWRTGFIPFLPRRSQSPQKNGLAIPKGSGLLCNLSDLRGLFCYPAKHAETYVALYGIDA